MPLWTDPLPFAKSKKPPSHDPFGVAISSKGAPARRAWDMSPGLVAEAHERAKNAASLQKSGQLAEAMRSHLEASRLFLDAAEQLQGMSETTGAALLLLSDGHAQEARLLHILIHAGETGPVPLDGLRRALPTSSGGQEASRGRLEASDRRPGGEGGAPAMPQEGQQQATASMYQSAVAHERSGSQQVEDMLQLEKALQSIGSQPLFTSSAIQAAAASWGGANNSHNPSGRYLSSTLGDSFFLVGNRQAVPREGAMWENSMLASSSSSKEARKHAASSAAAGHRERPPPVPTDPARKDKLRGQRPLSASATLGVGARGAAQDPTGTPKAGGGSAGFLDGVDSTHHAEVMRLLVCMKTLGDENAALLKQVEEGARLRKENEQLKREMQDFKDTYSSKLGVLKAALEEFRQKYPHELNPANYVASSADKSRIESLENELQMLHGRLNREKEASRKKDHVIRRYEAWYRTLKANAALRGQRGQAGQSGVKAGGPGPSGMGQAAAGAQGHR